MRSGPNQNSSSGRRETDLSTEERDVLRRHRRRQNVVEKVLSVGRTWIKNDGHAAYRNLFKFFFWLLHFCPSELKYFIFIKFSRHNNTIHKNRFDYENISSRSFLLKSFRVILKGRTIIEVFNVHIRIIIFKVSHFESKF
jgi:hypothetical protein